MSVKAMRSLDAETQHAKGHLTVSENFVLTILSWRLWKGTCNPSVMTIHRRTGMKEETVRTALQGLQEKGRITALGKNRRGVTDWRINLPESAAIAAQQTPPLRGRGQEIQPPPPTGRDPPP